MKILRALCVTTSLVVFVFGNARAQAVSTGKLVALIDESLDYPQYTLLQDDGTTIAVSLSDDVIRRAGGAQDLVGQNVTLRGRMIVDASGRFGLPAGVPETVFDVTDIAFAPGNVSSNTVMSAATALSGPQPFAVLLCKFSDVTTEPTTAASMTQLVGGANAPSVNNFWTENSEGRINLNGSQAFGWFTMKNTYNYYYGSDYGTRFTSSLNRDLALRDDCAAAADAVVYFPNFAGIDMQFNSGSGAYGYLNMLGMTRDGVYKQYRTAYLMTAMTNQAGTHAHEIGHTFGLYHSGAYGKAYISKWDVMSSPGAAGNDPLTGWWYGKHTISYHKDFLGWIPATRKWLPGDAAGNTFVIERSGLPPAGNFQMAQIPIPNLTNTFYTVETRRSYGYYEGTAPSDAVIIHRVNPSDWGTGSAPGPAQVVDVDNNGDPNDAGAMWVPGERFLDTTARISVTVNAATTTGFSVTVADNLKLLAVRASTGGNGTVKAADLSVNCVITNGQPAASGCETLSAATASVTLTATPGDGYGAGTWSGACTGSTATPCVVSMFQDQVVTASFAFTGIVSTTRKITMRASGGSGVVVADSSGINCTITNGAVATTGCQGAYNLNSVIVLTAAPALGFLPGNWAGACTGPTTTPCAITVTNDVDVYAYFTAARTLTIKNSTGSGAVVANSGALNCKITAGVVATTGCQATYAQGTSVVLTATPATGYKSGKWGGSCSGSMTKPCTLPISADLSVSANFTASTSTVAAANYQLTGLETTFVARALLTHQGLNNDQLQALDVIGNGNGVFDLPDYLAFAKSRNQ